jgi:phi13 family phage major tail protein
MANKVKYGLSNCYYAVLDETAGTYGTPVAMPGAVNLSLDQEGETNNFRADNMDYYVSVSNNGYSGDLELALIPDSFLTDVMGEVVGTNGLQYEIADAKPKAFALLFQFEGDEHATRHVLYNCKATRPTLASQTTDTSIEPVTETISLTAIAKEFTIDTSTVKVVKAKCKPTDTAYDNFFTAVQTPNA